MCFATQLHRHLHVRCHSSPPCSQGGGVDAAVLAGNAPWSFGASCAVTGGQAPFQGQIWVLPAVMMMMMITFNG
jgi:hypothetical protein